VLLSDQEENAEAGSIQEENAKVGSIHELWGEPVGSLEHSAYSGQLIKKAVHSHQKLGLLM